jgi:LmbE family N-acetylglucosaminyl deacetylase
MSTQHSHLPHHSFERTFGHTQGMTETPDLLPLEIDVGRVLAVVAHPDDLEYGAAAAVALWTQQGHDVAYVLATRGEAGIDGMAPEVAGPLREQEQRASAAVVGVDVVEFLGHPDGTIERSTALRRDISRAIRRHRPDTLLLFNHRDTWAPGRLNSPDHRNLGNAALDAAGDAGNRWIFADLGLEPHHVQHAVVAGSSAATHALDVTGTVDLAVASLAEHRAYLEGLGDHAMSDPEFLRVWLESTGQRFRGEGAALSVELFSF